MLRATIFKPLLRYIYRPLVMRYIAGNRHYRYKGLRLAVPEGVFHPGLFFSTRYFATYLLTLPVAGQTLLELGSGSGLLALLMARRQALVTATDINPESVSAINRNARENQLTVEVLSGDLFEPLDGRRFDWIVINPPYFPRNPQNAAEHAWYCGEDFRYFRRLFAGLGPHLKAHSQVLLVLSEDCQLDQIEKIAATHNITLVTVAQKRIWGEQHSILRLNFAS